VVAVEVVEVADSGGIGCGNWKVRVSRILGGRRSFGGATGPLRSPLLLVLRLLCPLPW
jgi:hypothetical protein